MDQVYKRIISLQNRCNDWLDMPSSGTARSLRNEIQRLEDEAQVKKSPKTLETRARGIVRLLHQAGDDATMSHGHADELVKQFEDLANQLRRM